MPFSPIDALMQVATPTRSSDAPSRHDGPNAFAPAFEQAYRAETPRVAESLPETPKPKAENSAAQGKPDDSDRSTDEKLVAAEGAEAVAATEQEEEAAAEADDSDAVEISAEGAAAAGVVPGVKRADVLAGGQAKAGETAADAVQQVDADGTAEAAKKQADEAAAAAQQEGELEATSTEEEAASEQSKEPTVSSFHSARDRQQGNGHDRDGDHAASAVEASGAKSDKEQASETPLELQLDAENDVSKLAEDEVLATSDNAESAANESAHKEATDAKSEAKSTEQKFAAMAGPDAVIETANQTDVAADDVSVAPPNTTADSTPPASDASPKSTASLDRLLAGHSLKSSKESSDPNGTPTVDRARFVQRVEGAMKAAQHGDGKIQVRLSPPDLGSVKIEIAVQNGVLSAKLEAETLAARNLLLDSLPALRERLAQQDIRIEKFDVDVRDQGGNAGSGQADGRTADQSGERQPGRPRPAAHRLATVAAAPSPRGLASSSSAAAGLDVRV